MTSQWTPKQAWFELTSDERRRIMDNDAQDPVWMQDFSPEERREFRKAVEQEHHDWRAIAHYRKHGRPQTNYHAGPVTIKFEADEQ